MVQFTEYLLQSTTFGHIPVFINAKAEAYPAPSPSQVDHAILEPVLNRVQRPAPNISIRINYIKLTSRMRAAGAWLVLALHEVDKL